MEEIDRQLQYMFGRIKELRKQKSISLLELSVKANMSLSFLAAVEKGKKQPSVQTLLRLACALDVNPKTFFLETGATPKDEIKDAIINLVRSL